MNMGSGSGNGGGVIDDAARGIIAGDLPFRTSAPAGVFAYGCPPIQPDITPIGPPMPPILPVAQPFDWSKMHPEVFALTTCVRCNRHHRVAEPCPFCMRDDLDALKLALGANAKPAEEIERLRIMLRKLLGAMRDIHKVTASQRLADLITEGDLVLGHASKTTP